MIRYKSKKILALILSGVLIAGSVPVTSNAAEQSGESTEEYVESTDGQYTDSTEENRAAGKDTPEESTDEESKPESSAAHTDEESKPEESTVEGSTDEENAAEENTNEENAADENSTKENTTEINSSEESTASETTENVTETETDTTETDTKETETESETETEETEEDFKVLLSDRQIAETDNILSDYNTSFEGTDENGKLHWWNHEAETGAKGSIAQGKYEENQKPSSECGNNYLQVQAESGKNKAYICDSNITGSMKPQVTYEFTYYAKLAEGTDSGEVQFQVTSVSKDWSSQKPASIELDNEITLDAAQWKQVSGTFKLPAHDQHEQVKVEFSGSEGVSFCIDDLRIAAVEDENTGGDRVISNNILSDYNTSFEGVDEGGKLYWWNGPSWSQDGIARKSYEDNKAPISDCGAYYVEVSPYDGKSEAQVNHDNIGAIIQPEIIYEFT